MVYNPPPSPALAARTPSSYSITAGTAEDVAAALVGQGWRAEAGHSPHELARLRDGARGLIVVYPASILIQGQVARGHAALAALVEGGRPW